ncbi:S-layer homology domain-containing protein, partial [Bacillus sp. D-CC]
LHLTNLGIFKGDENGNFRPKDTLTRAELAQILTKAYELKAKSPFSSPLKMPRFVKCKIS